jgi:enoyl-CoA hydratase/carnithine racemase
MADETELVHVERRDDGVAVVTLDNPKVNALSSALLGQLKEVADGLHADPPGAVVITGGDRLFAAGADISEFGGPHEAAVIGGHFVATMTLNDSVRTLVLSVWIDPLTDEIVLRSSGVSRFR